MLCGTQQAHPRCEAGGRRAVDATMVGTATGPFSEPYVRTAGPEACPCHAPFHLPTLYCSVWDFSAGAVGRGHAVTVGSDHILITEAVRNIHS